MAKRSFGGAIIALLDRFAEVRGEGRIFSRGLKPLILFWVAAFRMAQPFLRQGKRPCSPE